MITSLSPLPAPPPHAASDPGRSGTDTDAEQPFELGDDPAPEPAAAGGPASAPAAPPPDMAEPAAATSPAFGPSNVTLPGDVAAGRVSAAAPFAASASPSADSTSIAGSTAPKAAEGAAPSGAGAERRQALRGNAAALPLRPDPKAAPPVQDEVRFQQAAPGAAVLAATQGLAAALRAAMPDAPGGGPSTGAPTSDGPPTPGATVTDAPEETGPVRPPIAPDAASMRMALDAAAAPGGAAPGPRDAQTTTARADAPAPAPQPAPMSAAPVALSTNAQTIELVMAPDELGALRVQVTGEGDAMRLTLAAERPETLDLMRRHGDALLADLRQSGHGGAALAFGQWSGPAGSHAGGTAADPGPPGDAAEAALPAPVTARAASAGLDLRL